MFLDVYTDVVDLAVVCRGFMRFHEVMCETGKSRIFFFLASQGIEVSVVPQYCSLMLRIVEIMKVVSVMLINTSIRAP